MAGLLTLLVPPVLLSWLLIMERIESRLPPNEQETEDEDDFPTPRTTDSRV